MIGQLEIKKSRKYATDELDENFSLRDFHYQVNYIRFHIWNNNFPDKPYWTIFVLDDRRTQFIILGVLY